MRIRVLPRKFFERIRGTPEEETVLNACRIISINSSREFDAEPPFSPELRHHPHLLTLTFDDVVREEPEDPEAPGDAVPFTRAMAKAVADFAKEAGSLPLLIHCTAGISRSGCGAGAGDRRSSPRRWRINCSTLSTG